jgi:hypothetical protein
VVGGLFESNRIDEGKVCVGCADYAEAVAALYGDWSGGVVPSFLEEEIILATAMKVGYSEL